MNFTLHEGYLPGCIGKIVELHSQFYSPLAGFGVEFEAKVATELAQFCLHFDARQDALWLLVQNGVIEGSIAIHRPLDPQRGAHLRWFITSPKCRGTGIGSRLLASAVDFCRASHYGKVYLWTFDGLHAARHLYEKAGFQLVEQFQGTQWGKEVTEQRFELHLA